MLSKRLRQIETQHMQRHKQGPSIKNEVKQMSQETPAMIFAFLSVSLTDAKETNFFDWLTNAAWSTWFSSEHQGLWERAEHFFQREMGLRGRLLKVQGDLKPAANYLILAPRVQLQPNLLLAAKEFMKGCASFTSLKLQLQIGRSFLVDHSGKRCNDLCSAYCQDCAFILECLPTS